MSGKEVWDDLWEKHQDINEEDYFKCVVDAVLENINIPIENAKILEAGAGTGTSSFQLAKKGAQVSLVDYSEKAIIRMEQMFRQNSLSANFFCDDIRNMDIDDNSYDIVFNSGVMEHFPYDQQVAILREMRRICKPNGLVITMNPNAKCLLYRVWKYVLEQIDQWAYGEENPVLSLSNQYREVGLELVREYSIGFEEAIKQFSSFNEFKLAAQYMSTFYYSLSRSEKQLIEGYLLCSVGKK